MRLTAVCFMWAEAGNPFGMMTWVEVGRALAGFAFIEIFQHRTENALDLSFLVEICMLREQMDREQMAGYEDGLWVEP